MNFRARLRPQGRAGAARVGQAGHKNMLDVQVVRVLKENHGGIDILRPLFSGNGHAAHVFQRAKEQELFLIHDRDAGAASVYFHHQRGSRSLRCSHRRNHRRHHNAGAVTRVAKRRLVLFQHLAHHHGRYHAHARFLGRLRNVGNLGLLHIERQRLLEPETDDTVGFFRIGWQSVEVEQHDTRRRIRQHCDHILRASRNLVQYRT